jgi:hypothetical protein
MAKPALRVVSDDEESGLGKPLPVRLSRIMRFEEQPRRYFDQKGLEDLAEDIQENARQNPGTNGQKTPVRGLSKYSCWLFSAHLSAQGRSARAFSLAKYG